VEGIELHAVLATIAANGMVYISRRTELEGREPTISWQLANRLSADNWIEIEPGDRRNYARNRHNATTYLENVYLDSRPGMPKRYMPHAYDIPESFVKRIEAAGIKGAQFDPKEQRIGVPLPEWEAILKTLRGVGKIRA